jgi:hypothetical protein
MAAGAARDDEDIRIFTDVYGARIVHAPTEGCVPLPVWVISPQNFFKNGTMGGTIVDGVTCI